MDKPEPQIKNKPKPRIRDMPQSQIRDTSKSRIVGDYLYLYTADGDGSLHPRDDHVISKDDDESPPQDLPLIQEPLYMQNLPDFVEDLLSRDYNSFISSEISPKYSTLELYYLITVPSGSSYETMRQSEFVTIDELIKLFSTSHNEIPYDVTKALTNETPLLERIARVNYKMMDSVYSLKSFFRRFPREVDSRHLVMEAAYCLNLYYFTLFFLNYYGKNLDQIDASLRNNAKGALRLKKNLKHLVKDVIEHILTFLFKRGLVYVDVKGRKRHSFKNHLSVLISIYSFITETDFREGYGFRKTNILYKQLEYSWKKNRLAYEAIIKMGGRSEEIQKQLNDLQTKLMQIKSEMTDIGKAMEAWDQKIDGSRNRPST